MSATQLPQAQLASGGKLRDPDFSSRVFWLSLAIVLLWPLGVATEFRPWVLWEPDNRKVTLDFLASFWPLVYNAEFMHMVVRETWRTVAMATAGVTLALVLAVAAEVAALVADVPASAALVVAVVAEPAADVALPDAAVADDVPDSGRGQEGVGRDDVRQSQRLWARGEFLLPAQARGQCGVEYRLDRKGPFPLAHQPADRRRFRWHGRVGTREQHPALFQRIAHILPRNAGGQVGSGDNSLHPAVVDQEGCIFVERVPIEDAACCDGEGLAHWVSVTFFSATGLSGLKPRARERDSIKP